MTNSVRKYFIGPVVAGFLLLAATSPAETPGADIRRDATVEAVERVMPCVVNIATETILTVQDPFEEFRRQFFDPYHRRQAPHSELSLGSGVIIDEAGYVLTNDHVVRRADKISVKVYGHDKPYEAKLISSNPRSDIALIKLVAAEGERFTAVRFAPDDDLLLGETVLALGNPFGLGGSVSRGILSSKSRSAPKENGQLDVPNWLQTDASINPGNSGGPLVNLRGELIGLNVAILPDAQGIGFAIPIKLVGAALSEILTPESSGKSLWFGARVKVGSRPLVVTTVQPQSPAERAGLRPGDHILRVDGRAPREFIEFNEMLVNHDQPDITLTVESAGKTRDVSIRLVPENSFFNADLIQKLIGVKLRQGNDGYVVTAVDKDSAAADYLQPRYLITAIDDESAGDLTATAKFLYTKKKGEKIKLDVTVRQPRGGFVFVSQGRVELPVR